MNSTLPVVSPPLDQIEQDPIDPVRTWSEECIRKLVLKALSDDKTVSESLQECILKSQFDIDPILEPSEDPTCDGPCKCVPHQDCNWSKKMFEDMNKLSKNGLAYQTGYRFLKNKVCDYSRRLVYCCTGDKHPSEEQVKKLKVIEPCGSFGNKLTRPYGNEDPFDELDMQIQCLSFSDENKFPEPELRFR